MMTFLSSSLAAGALILLTALVRRFAGSRLPRRMYIALWDIAVLRLLIPVGLPRTDGAFAAYVQTSAFVQPLQAETVTADMVDVQALSSTTETGFQLSETVRVALLVIWVAVALGLALYFIAAYIPARARLRNPCRTTTRDARRFCKRIRSAAACRSA